MSNLQTERLINKTRYMFSIMFLLTAISSYLSKSAPATYLGIFGTCAVYISVAIVNQVNINKKIISTRLIYISSTIEILLIFALKYLLHFDPRVGYGMTIKEPASFLVYFLFLIIIALRYNKTLNIYAGSLAVVTSILLLVLAIIDGNMILTRDVVLFFRHDTIRLASEIPKVIFLAAFVFFISRMADFTNTNISNLEAAEKKVINNLSKTVEILATVEKTSTELLDGSRDLSSSSQKIDSILSEHGKLISQIGSIMKSVGNGIDEIRGKTNFQFETVEKNFAKIKDISNLMDQIHRDSTTQSTLAEEALNLATVNDQHIKQTINAILYMKENSKKIEEISKTISGIADQTNLLSLNAAIESARAGEHGKGFAVVADEISKLAAMSIDSSKEISMIIKNTVGNIENASSMIENMAQYLERIISFVRENARFMAVLKDQTLLELEESKKLHSSFIEVDNAAKDVIEHADNQIALIKNIFDWMKHMNILGSDVATTLNDLKSLSDTLRDRYEEMNSIIMNKEN